MAEKYPSLRYVAPFAALLACIAITPHVSGAWIWPMQLVVLSLVCFWCWPRELSIRPRYAWLSIAVGVAAFVIWVGPDLLLPNYRDSALFSNSFTGTPHSSLPPDAQRSPWILACRMARAVLVVPVAEELFWRAWLMRWIINADFEKVAIGTFAPAAFWITAILFGSEHGPYWDVGLVTGIIYNLWMVRTKSVADCILMHAVTNFVLSAYVLKTGNWQYWM